MTLRVGGAAGDIPDARGAGSVDVAETLVPGPWRHRFVAANGARFHVAETGAPGSGPLVLLLHGFPQFWWAWRRQLPALDAAGYRAVAMDLRGYGGSDKPPRGYDTLTLAADVAGVIRALGEREAVVVGHDWGGWLAWSLPGLAPRVTRAVAAIGAAHPLTLRAAARDPEQFTGLRPVLGFQLPMLPEHRLTRGDAVEDLLRSWSATPGWPDATTLERYRRAVRVPFVAHSSMEYFRWALRSLPRRDGRRFVAAVNGPVAVPVLQIHGDADPFVLPGTARASADRVIGGHRWETVRGGHFPAEEAPAAVTELLLDWLPTVTR